MNAQAYDVQRIDSRIDSVEKRVRVLEEFRWKAFGVGAALVFLFGGGRLSLDGILKMLGGQ